MDFLSLRHKPSTPTLFDHLGPWPWYMVSAELVALASFVLWSLPFRAKVTTARGALTSSWCEWRASRPVRS